jgi:Protein of unknown function (DUF4229)
MSTPAPGLAATIWLYTLARFGLVAAVAGVLLLAGVPLLIAVLVGLIVALPLSMVLFRGLRGRLDAALAEVRERRSAERAALRGRLRGDEGGPLSDRPRSSDEGTADQQPQHQPDRGER